MSGTVTILTTKNGREVGIVRAVFITRPDNTVEVRYPGNVNCEQPMPEIIPRDKFFSGTIARLDGTVDQLAIIGR